MLAGQPNPRLVNWWPNQPVITQVNHKNFPFCRSRKNPKKPEGQKETKLFEKKNSIVKSASMLHVQIKNITLLEVQFIIGYLLISLFFIEKLTAVSFGNIRWVQVKHKNTKTR